MLGGLLGRPQGSRIHRRGRPVGAGQMVVEVALGLPDAFCSSFRLLVQPSRQGAALVDRTSPVGARSNAVAVPLVAGRAGKRFSAG